MASSKLRLTTLVALVVGSMVGGGILSLPQNMAASAGAGAVLIGWAITAVGMLALAFVFQSLANRKPELDSGVYAYAKAGFSDYMGFSSAWGYWIGNVSYFVLLFSTLGCFFPVFGEGNTAAAIGGASLLLWADQQRRRRAVGRPHRHGIAQAETATVQRRGQTPAAAVGFAPGLPPGCVDQRQPLGIDAGSALEKAQRAEGLEVRRMPWQGVPLRVVVVHRGAPGKPKGRQRQARETLPRVGSWRSATLVAAVTNQSRLASG